MRSKYWCNRATTTVLAASSAVTLCSCVHGGPTSDGRADLAAGRVFYVSTTGSDANPGTLERPFATLEAARDAVRASRQHEGARGATVYLREGRYLRDSTFVLSSADSGAVNAPVVFRSYPGETARIIGGQALAPSLFAPITDQRIIAKLQPGVRTRVVELNLRALGLKHTGHFPDLFQGGGDLVQFFCNNQRMYLSRWPNGGYTTIQEVLDSGMAPEPHSATFIYRGDRPERWLGSLEEGIWLAGFWRVPWVIQSARVKAIDPVAKTITLAPAIPMGVGSKYTPEVNGTRKGDGKEPWFAMNVVEEIDEPGEWAIDFARQALYFLPPNDFSSAEMLISDLAAPVVALEDAAHVTLMGLAIEGGLKEAVRVTGGEHNLIAACTIRNTGAAGVVIASGRYNGVQSCNLHSIGAEGIRLSGGDRATLTPAANFAQNNHIHHYGQVMRIVSGIAIEGVGNRVAHNLIHDGPYGGVLYTGNDHLMEFNEIHNIGLDGGDLGAFYSSVDWSSRGNTIRYNFAHHAANANLAYMDDGHSGDVIYGNVAYRLGCGPFIGGGHDNQVRNNLLIDCAKGIHVDDRGIARRYNLTSKGHTRHLENINYRQPPWSTRYPELVAMMDRPELLEQPTGNMIETNVLANCGKPVDLSGKPESFQHMSISGNLITSEDLRLRDIASLDLRLGPESPVFRDLPGFAPIPFEKIGLQKDPYRTSLPSAGETGRFESRPPRRLFNSSTDMEATNRVQGERR